MLGGALSRDGPNCITLKCIGTKKRCEPFWAELSHISKCIEARDGSRLGRVRLQHSPARVGNENCPGQAMLEHPKAMTKLVYRLYQTGSEQPTASTKICGWEQAWLRS